MGRRRKVPVINEEKENEKKLDMASGKASMLNTGPIYTIMSKVQLNETFHNKYIKDLKQLYNQMDHDAFIFTFIKMIKTAMVAEETNEFAYTTLWFCAKFVSSFDGEETHPLLADICRWLLTTISNNPHIRFRLCQFVNMILNALGNEATLDDTICDGIMEYMVGRLVDISPSVRVQAILAMQRLQVPDNPDDPVLRSYQYHLCSDPSPRVRQAVITSMGRNYHTIPYILDRLWDIDEKVRRHTYLHMSSYPVRSYKVSQRLTLLEQGLNDRSESVRKVVTNVMLQQWIESYQKDIVALIGALKLDSTETEINRYRKIGKQVLKEIFKRQSKADIISCLQLEEDVEFYRCVPHVKLNLETAFYWQCLAEYLQNEIAEELDYIIPELSIFCAYIESYCQSRKTEMDKFEAMEFQYILLSLLEILYLYDLGDEIGRCNLHNLLLHLLKNYTLDETVVEVIIKCSENLITDQNTRHQFFLDIIHDICGLNAKQQDLVHDRNLISELLANSMDADLNLKLSSLKVKILDLEEQEMNYVQIKEYVRAQQIIDEKNNATEEFTNLLRPLLEKRDDRSGNSAQPQFSKVVKHDCILRSLQITYYMVVSKRVKTLSHNTCRLYNDFIFRNIASNQIAIRDWALKCGSAFSMLYEPLAKDVFNELYAQFFKNHNIRIWETAITCIFELLDRYGVDCFAVQEEQNKTKKTGRQLYNTLEFIDADDDARQSTTLGQGVGVIYMMSHFLDTCDDMCIVRAIINGFCRLVLHGHIDNRDIIEKLLLRYFNPATEPEINQILGVFLQNLIQHRKQNLLQPCLMATVNSVLTAPYDSPLHDIRPETITRFIIDATRSDVISNTRENLHNKLALVFLNEMLNNASNKELCKLLAKELITLEVNMVQQVDLKNEMKELTDKLIVNKYDPKTVKHIIDFKDMLDGVFNPPPKRNCEDLESDEDDDEDDAEANASERNNETENLDIMSETSTEATRFRNKTSSEPHFNSSTHEIDCTQDESNNTADHTTKVSPSPLNMPTTFGTDNNTSHRFLRKSLNLSRNSSVDSNGTYKNDQINKPNKIRIEARIDSDKQIQNLYNNNSTGHTKTRKGLRRNLRNKNTNVNDELYDDLFSNSKPREPEIIEKILNPSKTKSASKNMNDFQHTPDIQPTIRVIEQNITPQKETQEYINKEKPLPQHLSLCRSDRSSKEINIEQLVTTNDEPDTPEIIPESPKVKSAEIGALTTRLRSNTSLQSMRSRTYRNVSKQTAKTMGTSAIVTMTSTPLRNGRKRVFRTSPKMCTSTASAVTSSPVRKQLCIEIDQQGISKGASTSSAANNCNVAKSSSNSSNAIKTLSSALKQKYFGKRNEKKIKTESKNENTASITSSQTLDIENEVSENKRAENNSSDISQNDHRKFSLCTRQRPNKNALKTHEDTKIQRLATMTRNTVKRELLSNMIITRNRLSQENVSIQTIYSRSATNADIRKSRIPVRKQKRFINAERVKNKISPFTSEKRLCLRKPQLESGKTSAERS